MSSKPHPGRVPVQSGNRPGVGAWFGTPARGSTGQSGTLRRLGLRPAAWTRDAVCARPDADPGLWHSDNPASRLAARTLCAACPVRLACAVGALERAELYGVWGGLDRRDRREVARRHGYPLPGASQHGTRSAYVAGCRCTDCRRAHATYEHQRRVKGRRGTARPKS